MGWYALEEIGEALEETRELLLPFDLRKWTKLALIVLLTGSGLNLPTSGLDVPTQSTGDYSTDIGETTQVPESSIPGFETATTPETGELAGLGGAATGMVIAVLALVFFFIALPLILLSSIFEFIFYRSLIDKEVKLVKDFSDNIGNGLRYFGFRIIYTLFILVTLGAAIFLGMTNEAVLIPLILGMIPVLIVLTIFAGLTHDFVLLRMMERDEGLIEAWRSFWPVLTGEWKQVIVYLITKFFLQISVGILSATVILTFTVIAAIPVIIMAFLLSTISEVLVLVPVLLGLLAWFIVLLYIAVPFRTYVYYYVILVYHDLTS